MTLTSPRTLRAEHVPLTSKPRSTPVLVAPFHPACELSLLARLPLPTPPPTPPLPPLPPQRTPQGHSFSDHVAVHATLRLPAPGSPAPPPSTPPPSSPQTAPGAAGAKRQGHAAAALARARQYHSQLDRLLASAHEVLGTGAQAAVQAAQMHQLFAFMMFAQVGRGVGDGGWADTRGGVKGGAARVGLCLDLALGVWIWLLARQRCAPSRLRVGRR